MDRHRETRSGSPVRLVYALILVAALAACSGGPEPGSTPTPGPPPNAAIITFYTSGTKANWIRDVTEGFNAARNETAAGHSVWVQVEEVDSGDFLPQLQDGRIQDPTVWSPGEISWVNEANVVWQQQFNRPLVVRAHLPAGEHDSVRFDGR